MNIRIKEMKIEIFFSVKQKNSSVSKNHCVRAMLITQNQVKLIVRSIIIKFTFFLNIFSSCEVCKFEDFSKFPMQINIIILT